MAPCGLLSQVMSKLSALLMRSALWTLGMYSAPARGTRPGIVTPLPFTIANLEPKKGFDAQFRQSKLFPRTGGWSVLSEKENGPNKLILLLTVHHRLTNIQFETKFPPGPKIETITKSV